MPNSNAWRSGTAALIILGLATSATAPIALVSPAAAQKTFPDVPSGYWAGGFIQELVNRGIIAGFPDGTFRPEEAVTRAQFASMIRKAFQKAAIRTPAQFSDVPANYWASEAIQQAYTTGFLAGYPGNVFRPDENIPRAQILVSLANGLNYSSTANADTLLQTYFNDAASTPTYARPSIAAALEKRIVVSYPDVRLLNPNQQATRAEVAAFIYQALVSAGQTTAIASPYIVGQAPTPVSLKIPAGTSIPVRYDQADRILLARDEPKPSPISLKVAQNIVTAQGETLIPAGSTVVGELRIVQGGAQFFASEVVFPDGKRLPINATSEVITKTETIRQGASTTSILAGTVVGAGAAAAIAGVTGDRTIRAEEVLGGAAVGAILGAVLGNTQVELLTINPNTDLNLTLGSDLVIR